MPPACRSRRRRDAQEQRPLLVLDVEETLIHCPDGVLDRQADFWVGEHAIYERPGEDEMKKPLRELDVLPGSLLCDEYGSRPRAGSNE